MLTVKQLSQLAGVTPRTLHYYDEIGLLKPSQVGDNGYRYYSDEALLRLQQILLYRELDLPLEKIKDILGNPRFDVLEALEGHKTELRKRMQRTQRLIATVEQTIRYVKGTETMSKKQMFAAFSEEEQAEMMKEAEQLYDTEVVRASNQRWKKYSAAEKQRIFDEGNAIYNDIIAAIPLGPASAQAQQGIERWRQHMSYFWTPNDEQLLALATHYNDEPRFKANFEAMHPQLAVFMRQAVEIYLKNKK